MKTYIVLGGLLLLVGLVAPNPIVKREAEDDLSPLNEVRSTTEEDIPEFDRQKVSLDVPPQAFGTGFTLITNLSKVLSNFIMNSAYRTQSVLEVFKPVFRGKFAIKGLPSDDLNSSTKS